jgi:mycothiol synthase
VAVLAQAVLEAALQPALLDDRFDGWRPGPSFIGAFATQADEPVGFLGGSIDRGRLQLDGLIVEADHRRIDQDPIDQDGVAGALYRSLLPMIDRAGAEVVELWGKPAQPWHQRLADANGFTPLRSLHQLRCSLPVAAEPIPSRSFVPGRDEGRLVAINNRAFATHPDQGSLTVADVEEAASHPWFNADGIRLLDDPDDADRLAGFCWTKIHQPVADGEPALGEIYVIGIDPDHHGKGLGVPMTAAGLSWLAEQGLTTGMLYVEADNHPALRTYEKLGFVRHRTDSAWSRRL